jgi:hypothetical protein
LYSGSTAGATFKVETAAVGADAATAQLRVVITTLSLQGGDSLTNRDLNDDRNVGATPTATISLGVPAAFRPRTCTTSAVNATMPMTTTAAAAATLLAACPGLASVQLSPVADGPAFTPGPEDSAVEIALSAEVGGTVSFVATVLPLSSAAGPAAAAAAPPPPPPPSHAEVVASVAAARAALVAKFDAFGSQNDTFAGLTTAISWNVIWTPYEGIFTPVFRGSPWSVSERVGGVSEWERGEASQ